MDMNKEIQVVVGASEPIASGEYIGTFVQISDPVEGEHGPYFRFEFDGEDGKTYWGFCDVPNRATIKNKYGRWLCGLAGKKPEATAITPSEYVGKRYKLLYTPNKNGNVTLNAFSPIS